MERHEWTGTTPARPSVPVLHDRWAPAEAIPLDGALERQRFSPLLLAIVWPVVAIVLYQFVISPIALVVVFAASGVPASELLADLPRLVQERIGDVLTVNTIAQILGLALPAWLVARGHTRRAGAFLRLRAPDAALLGLAVLGLVALTPVVQWLGTLNQTIPVPDWWELMEQSRADFLESAFTGDLGLPFLITMVAVTPALCEELLFRGYIQRQAERSMGVAGGIAFAGIIFGAFHLSLTQIVPLSVLGVYLAYITWRTGSLWPAIVVHFVNNAAMASLATYLATSGSMTLEQVEQYTVPLYAVAAGAVGCIGVIAAMQHRARQQLAARPALVSSTDERTLP